MAGQRRRSSIVVPALERAHSRPGARSRGPLARPSRNSAAPTGRPRARREGAYQGSLRPEASTRREPVKLPLGSRVTYRELSLGATAAGTGRDTPDYGSADLAGTFPSRRAAPPATALGAPNPASSSEPPPRSRWTAPRRRRSPPGA